MHTNNLDRCLQLKQNGLTDENLARFGAQGSNFKLGQVNLFAGPLTPHLRNRRMTGPRMQQLHV